MNIELNQKEISDIIRKIGYATGVLCVLSWTDERQSLIDALDMLRKVSDLLISKFDVDAKNP